MELTAAHDYVRSHLRHAIVVTAVLFVPAVVWLWLQPDQYTATAKLLPQHDRLASGGLGDLAGVASSFGLSLGGGSSGYEQFPAIIKSRRLLLPVATRNVPLASGDSVSVAELLGIDEPKPELRTEKTIKKLMLNAVSVVTDRKTKVLSIQVTMKDPVAAAVIANQLSQSLNEFNRLQINTTATDQRQFIEGRLTDVSQALADAESRLESFRASNQMIRASASLQLEESRLMRNVSLQAALYTELQRQLEIQRIDERRNTSTISVLEQASAPVIPAGPRRARMAALALAGSLVAGYLLLFAQGVRIWGR
ncbi:MAG: hypothetical protein IPG61_02605 [bacterium]|nr:hypothetical protein [bacterium]